MRKGASVHIRVRVYVRAFANVIRTSAFQFCSASHDPGKIVLRTIAVFGKQVLWQPCSLETCHVAQNSLEFLSNQKKNKQTTI